MELFNMMAMSAPIPEGVYSVDVGSVLVALIAVIFALGAVLILGGNRTNVLPAIRPRSSRHLTAVRRPSFGVAR